MARISKQQAMEDDSPGGLYSGTSLLPPSHNKFKVPRKDAKGQSAHVNFYTAPYYIRIASELKEKVKDFDNLSDVFSCALHYGLIHIQEQDGVGYTSVHSALQAWMTICQDSELDEDIMVAQDRLRGVVQNKVNHGAAEEARRIIAEVRYATEQMPLCYYREKALEFLDQEFKFLYENGGSGKNGNGKVANGVGQHNGLLIAPTLPKEEEESE